MSITLGIHHDHVHHANGEEQSFSARWTELAVARGFQVRQLNVRSDRLFDELGACDAFMWRFGFSHVEVQAGRRLITAIEHARKIPVYPSSATAWHFEDKIAQYYLLVLGGFPVADTHVFWTRGDALKYCATAAYPFVVKLARGIQSRNVALVRTRKQAETLISRMFGSGLSNVQPSASRLGRLAGRHALALKLLAGKPIPKGTESGYFYAQEFLPGNDNDTRVTVIGRRAFAFRRFNRPNDFRASGSGRLNWDPAEIDPEMLRLAFDLAAKLHTQSVGIDFLRKDGKPVIVEINFPFASWAIRECPGHWVRRDATGSAVEWIPGSVRAEDAIFEDFTAGW